jgi:hypothetical protein
VAPSHFDPLSHAPSGARHTVPSARIPLGQAAVVPVQFWFESHVPPAV